MAKFYPPGPLSGPNSEREVAESLKRLDDDWYVLHSVAWQSVRWGRQGDGEADFLLLHRDGGAIVLEVKGGHSITIQNGDWYSTGQNGTHKIKNPFAQAKDSKYALIKYLEALGGEFAAIRVMHAVAFPGLTVDGGFGMYGPREIILDLGDLQNIRTAIASIIAHWNQSTGIPEQTITRLVKKLAPTVSIKRALKDEAMHASAALLELTDRQKQAFHQTRLLRRALVLGGAGTGKTVLAVERAKQLSQEGFSVVLVCYNELLSCHLEQALQETPGVSASTFHSLCFQLASKAGLEVPIDPPREWWERDAADMLIQAAERTGFSVDAVVVDEGQDFSSSWLVALNMILADSENSPMYVFADSHQDLYQRDWQLPDDWPRIPLDLNCRNTHPIAERVAALYGEVPITNQVNGPKPRFVRVRRDRDLLSDVPAIVDDLLRTERMAAENVVVLTDSPSLAASIRELTVGQESFCEYGQVGVVVETIKRFKGLEADAVVVVFSQASAESQDSLRNSAYVALSRARSILLVLAPDRARPHLAWT